MTKAFYTILGKENRLIVLAFLLGCALVVLAKFIKVCLIGWAFPEWTSHLIASILSKVIWIPLFLWIIIRNDLTVASGLAPYPKFQHWRAYIMPLFILGLAMVSSVHSIYQTVSFQVLVLYFVSDLLVGIGEELTFRGVIQSLFIQKWRDDPNGTLKGVLAAAIIFGLAHYTSLLREPDNFAGVTRQVFFATSLGIFFGGLLLRTKKLIPVGILHGLINFTFGAETITQENSPQIVESVEHDVSWKGLILIVLIGIGIAISGIRMIRAEKQDLSLMKSA